MNELNYRGVRFCGKKLPNNPEIGDYVMINENKFIIFNGVDWEDFKLELEKTVIIPRKIEEIEDGYKKVYIENINEQIKAGKAHGISPENVSDGYHNFGELYKHRHALYIALCKAYHDLRHTAVGINHKIGMVWRSKLHSDNTMYDDMFIMGIGVEKGKQISYHLENEYWDKTNFAHTLDNAPEFDGHSSDDVIDRLMELIK